MRRKSAAAALAWVLVYDSMMYDILKMVQGTF